MATLLLIWKCIFISRHGNIMEVLQENILLARDQLLGALMLSTPLPENQWELEIQNVNNISLTLLRGLVTSHASVPDVDISRNATFHQYVNKEALPDAINLCRNQRIKTVSYYMISGIIIILLSYAVPVLVPRLSGEQAGSQAYTQQNGWINDDILLVDSLVLDAHGIGPWQTISEVPIPNNPGQIFHVPWRNKNWRDEGSKEHNAGNLTERLYNE
jgi:hypothetical protein